MQGYSAPGRKIAINPLAQLLHKTLFHELAHQVLGHIGDQTFVEGECLPRNLREWCRSRTDARARRISVGNRDHDRSSEPVRSRAVDPDRLGS